MRGLRAFLKAWFVLAAAITLTVISVGLLKVAETLADPSQSLTVNPRWATYLIRTVIFCAPVGLIGAVLGAPLVLIRRSVIGDRFPYVRRGYFWVMAYGPCLTLLLVSLQPQTPKGSAFAIALAYEVIAAAGTAVFVLIGRPFGVFDQAPSASRPEI